MEIACSLQLNTASGKMECGSIFILETQQADGEEHDRKTEQDAYFQQIERYTNV